MKKINTTKWQDYKVGELFDIHPTKSYKLNNAYLFDNGKNPVVVNSSYNNGIGGYTSLGNTEKGNIVTFSDTTSEDSVFYQADEFVGYPHVQGMYPLPPYEKEWDKLSLLFFLVIFKKNVSLLNVDYVNKFTRKLAADIVVKLPTCPNGTLDFDYMRRVIQSLINKTDSILNKKHKICKIYQAKNVDVCKWQDFPISRLFNIVKGKRLTKQDMRKGTIRYIGASAVNNGITTHIANNAYLHPANTITVSYNGSVGSSFYQNEQFWASDDVNVLYPKFEMTENIALFIATIIAKFGKEKYEFVDKWRVEYMNRDSIKLPVSSSGEPDFEYMENYISRLRGITLKRLAIFNTLVNDDNFS